MAHNLSIIDLTILVFVISCFKLSLLVSQSPRLLTSSLLSSSQLVYTGIEAKTVEGCPTAEWVIRRSSKEEQFLVLYR